MKECAKTMLRDLRRDEVAQAIANMVTESYFVAELPDQGTVTWRQVRWNNPEHRELTKKIRKAMDKAYAQA